MARTFCAFAFIFASATTFLATSASGPNDLLRPLSPSAAPPSSSFLSGEKKDKPADDDAKLVTPKISNVALEVLWVEPNHTPERGLRDYLNGFGGERFDAFYKNITDAFETSRITIVQMRDDPRHCVSAPVPMVHHDVPIRNRVALNEFPIFDKLHYVAESLSFFNKRKLRTSDDSMSAKKDFPTVRVVVLITETLPQEASEAAKKHGEYRKGGCANGEPTPTQVINSFKHHEADMVVIGLTTEVRLAWEKVLRSTDGFAAKCQTVSQIYHRVFQQADDAIAGYVKEAAAMFARRRFPDLFNEFPQVDVGHWLNPTPPPQPPPTLKSSFFSALPSWIASFMKFGQWFGL